MVHITIIIILTNCPNMHTGKKLLSIWKQIYLLTTAILKSIFATENVDSLVIGTVELTWKIIFCQFVKLSNA